MLHCNTFQPTCALHKIHRRSLLPECVVSHTYAHIPATDSHSNTATQQSTVEQKRSSQQQVKAKEFSATFNAIQSHVQHWQTIKEKNSRSYRQRATLQRSVVQQFIPYILCICGLSFCNQHALATVLLFHLALFDAVIAAHRSQKVTQPNIRGMPKELAALQSNSVGNSHTTSLRWCIVRTVYISGAFSSEKYLNAVSLSQRIFAVSQCRLLTAHSAECTGDFYCSCSHGFIAESVKHAKL